MSNKIFHIVLSVLMLSTVSCTHKKVWHQTDGAVWNTVFHMTYLSDANLDDSIQACLRNVEKSVSAFDQQSTASRINRNESAITDPIFRAVFTMARQICRESGGLFDPTISPLVNLWGFGYADNCDSVPQPQQIADALQWVGITDCYLQGDSLIKKSPETEFNFSALAKGFGCDEIGRMLARNGCNDYMIEIGGEIALHGTNRHSDKWRIMVDAPVDNDSTIEHRQLDRISISNCGIATSGNYRNYRDTAAGRTSHTIDPRTGYPMTITPADTLVLSSTVIASTAMEADALATACMLMNPHAAMAAIDADTTRAALLVVKVPGSDIPQIIVSQRFPSSNR